MIFITHDLAEALKLGDRIAIMKDGHFVQVGTPEEVVAHPADDYVADFTKDVPRAHVLTARTVMQPAAGNGQRYGGDVTPSTSRAGPDRTCCPPTARCGWWTGTRWWASVDRERGDGRPRRGALIVATVDAPPRSSAPRVEVGAPPEIVVPPPANPWRRRLIWIGAVVVATIVRSNWRTDSRRSGWSMRSDGSPTSETWVIENDETSPLFVYFLTPLKNSSTRCSTG